MDTALIKLLANGYNDCVFYLQFMHGRDLLDTSYISLFNQKICIYVCNLIILLIIAVSL